MSENMQAAKHSWEKKLLNNELSLDVEKEKLSIADNNRQQWCMLNMYSTLDFYVTYLFTDHVTYPVCS